MGDTFQRVVRMEDFGVISSSSPGGRVSKAQLQGHFGMEGNKMIFAEPGEAVNVFHQLRWTMKDLEERAKKFSVQINVSDDRQSALEIGQSTDSWRF